MRALANGSKRLNLSNNNKNDKDDDDDDFSANVFPLSLPLSRILSLFFHPLAANTIMAISIRVAYTYFDFYII